jgi:predicted transcriptional regulator of viral defense system
MRNGTSGTALHLLQALLEVSYGGRVFTSDEAVAVGTELGISPGHTYKLLTELTDRGILQRPRGRLYVMQPPFGGMSPVRPIAIAVHAVQPAAVSGDTALAHWDLIDQAPLHEEVISTPARIQWTHGVRVDDSDRLWTVEGTIIRFRHVLPREMFGITSVRLDSETVVPIFDRERAILELLTQPTHGYAEWAAELLKTRGHDIDITRLKDYARRVDATEQVTRALSAGAQSTPVLAS